MREIGKKLGQLTRVSMIILKYGMQIACAVLGAGLFMQVLNINSESYSLSLSEQATATVESAVSIFAIVVIGSLLFDYTYKKHNCE